MVPMKGAEPLEDSDPSASRHLLPLAGEKRIELVVMGFPSPP